MKTKRIIFIVLGWLFIFINAVAYLDAIDTLETIFENKSFPFILGYNFWFMAGIGLLLLANKEKRKMQRAREKEVLHNFLVEQNDRDGNPS